jgi:putative ABC transport system substrate-binding protein
VGWLKIQNKDHTPGQLKAFLTGLREAGDEEGGAFVLETRFADGNATRLVTLASELIEAKTDIILATSQPVVDASLKVTRSVPIVGRMTDDPVQIGAAKSLAHPGGNLTGVYTLLEEMTAKRLALLVQAAPSVRKVGALVTLDRGASDYWVAEAQKAAKQLNLEIYVMNVHSPDELDGLFAQAAAAGVNGLLAFRNPTVVTFDRRVAQLAQHYSFPNIFDARDFVDVGALMSYGPNLEVIFQRLGNQVHQILNGAKPADLPIEQPTSFELVINTKIANEMGLTIPAPVLVSADAVVD